MRKVRIFAILLVTIMMSFGTASYAGFIMKKQTTLSDSTSAVSSTSVSTRQSERTANYNTLKDYALQHLDGRGGGPSNGSGWQGIVALICGILGFAFGWPAILAIIFGAMGMGRGKRHRGMAIAGFVMGVVVTALLLIALIFVVALFSWY